MTTESAVCVESEPVKEARTTRTRLSLNYNADGEVCVPCVQFDNHLNARLQAYAGAIDEMHMPLWVQAVHKVGIVSIAGAFSGENAGNPASLLRVVEQLSSLNGFLQEHGLRVWENNVILAAPAARQPAHANDIRTVLYRSNWLPTRRHWGAIAQFAPIVTVPHMRLGSIDDKTACIAYGSTSEIESTINANIRTLAIVPESQALHHMSRWFDDERLLAICGWRE